MTRQQLISVLCELTSASKSITDDTAFKEITNKYEILFLGENYNHIYSLDLRHALEKKFGIAVTNAELNDIVPSVCDQMGLECSPMYAVSDLSDPNRIPHCYQIKLW